MESNESITLESGSLPVDNSREIARFHDVLGNPERLLIIGSTKDDNDDMSRFCYTRYQTDVETFDDVTFYDLPTIDLFADLIVEFCHEYNVNPLTCLSCVEQLVVERDITSDD